MKVGPFEVRLTCEEITPALVEEFVRTPECGAVVSFSGTVRNHHRKRKVLALEYEVFETFFYAEIQRLLAEALEKWKVKKAALWQRKGKLQISDTAVVVAVSAPHRREAFEACSFILENFKRRAPVWKKEYYPEGVEWVGCEH